MIVERSRASLSGKCSKAQILAGDLSDMDFWKIAGASGEGALFCWPHDPRKARGAKDVIAKMQRAGIDVNGYALYSQGKILNG